MGKARRKMRPQPPRWYWDDTDGCWMCHNRNNCGGCHWLKQMDKEMSQRMERREKNRGYSGEADE